MKCPPRWRDSNPARSAAVFSRPSPSRIERAIAGLLIESTSSVCFASSGVEVRERDAERPVPHRGSVGRGVDDRLGDRAGAARHHFLDDLADRRVEPFPEEERREVPSLAGEQEVDEIVDDEVDGQGPFTARARLKEQEVARAAEKQVPAADVILEEALEDADLGARDAPLAILEALWIAELELEARGREAVLPQQQDARHRLRRVHPPAAAIAAERRGRLDEREAAVGIRQAEPSGLGQHRIDAVRDLPGGVLEESQVSIVSRVHEDLELHAGDLPGPALEARRQQVRPA